MIMDGISQPAYFIWKICRRSLFMVRYMKSCTGIAKRRSGQSVSALRREEEDSKYRHDRRYGGQLEFREMRYRVMRITTLVENTEGAAGLKAEHGLSFYIETGQHTVLMDTGASDLLIRNAAALNVDLRTVDTVVISHGHYDHGGGLPAFMEINDHASIYIQRAAAGNYYALEHGEKPDRYIGLAPEVIGSDRITWLDGDLRIDDELCIFTGIGSAQPVPSGNRELKLRVPSEPGRATAAAAGTFSEKTGVECGYIQDDFRHEQCLVISEGDRLTLLSGCAHHGILNVLEHFHRMYGRDPDVVLSGFHMMQHDDLYTEEDVRQIRETAKVLSRMETVFCTGHCTAEKPYEIMREIMGEQVRYMHCGDQIELPDDFEY